MKEKKNEPALIAKITGWFLKIAGVASLVYYLLLLPYLGFSVSFPLFWIALGAVCLALDGLLRFIGKRSRRAQKRVSAVLAVLIAAALVLFVGVTGQIVSASLSRPAPDADYMLVLGARVKENGPSILLSYRIDRAADYLNENEKTVAILCGGQGSNEPMSEAQAMYDGLVERGIDGARLRMEDKSTSTEENIEFAKAFMEKENPSVVITTTGYHLYRALNTARALGLENVTGNPSECAWITPLNYYTREFFAVMRDWAVSL